MKRAEDGLPIVGSNSKELEIRLPPDRNADVDLDDNGHVITNGKGMSVAEHWKYLLGHLIPKRLVARIPGATGSNALTCYRLGSGAFVEGALNDDLVVIIKSHDIHAANVAPSRSGHIEDFQAALAATRTQWRPDET
ncbi:hypothetical protein [Aquisphaera insulae]|uniref:hypothetical protein n=1 Tax=Aquisphaera insulae TaxID=2712864 RepID=UPI0013ED6089|nr:hypothetical protein [Aquisphaera insulae]